MKKTIENGRVAAKGVVAMLLAAGAMVGLSACEEGMMVDESATQGNIVASMSDGVQVREEGSFPTDETNLRFTSFDLPVGEVVDVVFVLRESAMVSAVSAGNRLSFNGGAAEEEAMQAFVNAGELVVTVSGGGDSLEVAIKPSGHMVDSADGLSVVQQPLVAGWVLRKVKDWLKKTAFKRFLSWFDYCDNLEAYIESFGYDCPWSNDDPIYCPVFYLATCAQGVQ